MPLDDYLELERDARLVRRVEMFLAGRAAYSLADRYPKAPAERFLGHPCQPPFLRDWHNHFDNYGNWMPGYCGGISLGSWHELDELLECGVDLDGHPILGFLAAGDMRGLLRFAEERGYARTRDGYISKCHLCLDIRRHLAARGQFEELAPQEFYARVSETRDHP